MAKGGGGAWKVAYADFVTAMMAFFLVMWICGQDQAIKRAVSYYFKDPVGATEKTGSSKPAKSGSLADVLNSGSVPKSESVSLGKGRKSYTAPGERSVATKVVGDWLAHDKAASEHWREQAAIEMEIARHSKRVRERFEPVRDVAAEQLSRKLREEIAQGLPKDASPLYRDLLLEAVAEVNWRELAQDLVGRH